jgi:hypothetical protein
VFVVFFLEVFLAFYFKIIHIFRTCPDRPWDPPSLQYNWYRVFPAGKAAGAWRWPPTSI